MVIFIHEKSLFFPQKSDIEKRWAKTVSGRSLSLPFSAKAIIVSGRFSNKKKWEKEKKERERVVVGDYKVAKRTIRGGA